MHEPLEGKLLLGCFDCEECDMPFDEKHGMPRTPVYKKDLQGVLCSSCRGEAGTIIVAWWLIDLLNERWLQKEENGYSVCAEIKLPKCPDCSDPYTPQLMRTPIMLPCGHACCGDCYFENNTHTCQQCGNFVQDEEDDDGPADCLPILKLFQELAWDWVTPFELNLERVEVPEYAVWVECSTCRQEDDTDRMFRCFDCLTIVCAFCAMQKHHSHRHQRLSETIDLSHAERLEKGLAISLKCFNCKQCRKPFDGKVGMPGTPTINDDFYVQCASCQGEGSSSVPVFALVDFLEKPCMKKTDEGYICLQAPDTPKCPNCEWMIDTCVDQMLNLKCGHLMCQKCLEEGGNESKCKICQQEYSTEDVFANEQFLDFLYELATQWTKFSDTTKEPELVKPHAPLNCDDCSIEQPMERLLNCKDCSKITCGFCYVVQHMNHQFEKLFVAKLRDLEHTIDKRLEIGFIGLQGIVDGLHEQMKKRMRELVEVAAAKGKTIHDQPTFKDGQQIFGDLEEMVAKFESRCENYFPLIRQFSEKLVDWKEGLEGQDEQPLEAIKASQV